MGRHYLTDEQLLQLCKADISLYLNGIIRKDIAKENIEKRMTYMRTYWTRYETTRVWRRKTFILNVIRVRCMKFIFRKEIL